MIFGYVLHGLNVDAINTFRWVIQEGMVPNCLTMASVLPACAGCSEIREGVALFFVIFYQQMLIC